MTFIGGFFSGVFLTLGLILLLLFVAKVLGFSVMLRNEWRDAHGYYSHYGRYDQEGYGCHKCWYHNYYDRHRYDTKLNTKKPSEEESEEITEDELNDILNGSEVPEDEEEPIE